MEYSVLHFLCMYVELLATGDKTDSLLACVLVEDEDTLIFFSIWGPCLVSAALF